MEKEIGEVTHFFAKISVAVIKVTSGSMNVGDQIHIKGATTDFTQKVDSMQVEHEQVKEAKKGQEIGMKVTSEVRKNDKVYKVTA